QRPGTRHSVGVGAPGKAVLAQLPMSEWPDGVPAAVAPRVAEGSRRGYAVSHDEVIENLHSVAVPLRLRGRAPAAVAVVYVAGGEDEARLAARLQQAAGTITQNLDGCGRTRSPAAAPGSDRAPRTANQRATEG